MRGRSHVCTLANTDKKSKQDTVQGGSINIVPRIVTSPKKFVVGKGLLCQMQDFVKEFCDNAFIICDEFILGRVAEEAVQSLQKADIKATTKKFNYECSSKRWID
jgi:hypothetical protein